MKISIQDGDSMDKKEERKSLAAHEEGAEEPGEFAEFEEGIPELKGPRAKIEARDLPKKKKDEAAALRERIDNLTAELEKREKELREAEERSLRAVADSENYKKRLARENEEKSKYLIMSLLEDILPALDNLGQAQEAVEAGKGGLDQLREGVSMTRQQIVDILAKHGLEKLDVEGKPFDPATSEALQMQETDEHEDGHVMREFMPGYRYKDRIVRPAKVQVARNASAEPGSEG